ncbi:MAG: IS66 family transposase, partial [Chloroflexi bacterium]|nr:IS66 family transposase [Chloroflexota bacterium]
MEKLLEDSRRSGKRQAAPFSKGLPVEEPKRPGRRSGKNHGQHGHRAVPVGPVDRELSAPLPACCPGCGGVVDHERDVEQFQTELPDVRPVVTRFTIGVGRCRNCQRRVQGRHVEQTSDALGAAASQIGPHAKSLGVWLHYALGLSFAKTTQVLGRLGVPVTAGALSSSAQSTGTDLVPVHAAIVDRINTAAMVVMDETGWRVDAEGAWLWTATSKEATAYNVADGRGFDQATVLLDDNYTGTLVRDGWAVYRRYQAARHQTCIAHLLRRCTEMESDLPAWARATPREIKHILLQALDARDLPADERRAVIDDLAELIELIAEAAHPHDANRRLVKHLVNEADALFTFLDDTDIDATNWRGEQAIRPAVVNRKVWGGNRTWRGAAT